MDTIVKRTKPLFVLASIALASASAMAADLPDFVLNPSAAGLMGAPSSITADNIIISDYGTVNLTGSTFTDSGVLSVQSFQLNGAFVPVAGLNSTFGLYFSYSGSGNLTASGNPSTTFTAGSFTNLSFSLYGYSGGPVAFSPTVTSVAGATLLATGSVIPGAGMSFVTTTPQSPSFSAGAGANTTFTPVLGSFFTSPNPFYGMAVSNFSNTPTQVTQTSATSFTIQQGGGSVNFVTAVPEPETYALMLAGLGVVGMLARRRRQS